MEKIKGQLKGIRDRLSESEQSLRHEQEERDRAASEAEDLRGQLEEAKKKAAGLIEQNKSLGAEKAHVQGQVDLLRGHVCYSDVLASHKARDNDSTCSESPCRTATHRFSDGNNSSKNKQKRPARAAQMARK